MEKFNFTETSLVHNAFLPEEILFEKDNDYRNEYMFQYEVIALLILLENNSTLNAIYEKKLNASIGENKSSNNSDCFSNAVFERLDNLFDDLKSCIYLERYDVSGNVIFKKDVRKLKIPAM